MKCCVGAVSVCVRPFFMDGLPGFGFHQQRSGVCGYLNRDEIYKFTNLQVWKEIYSLQMRL
jgi:hypothetical protein